MRKITNLLLLSVFALFTSFVIPHANAVPSSDLRIMVMDPEGDDLGGGGDVFSVNPITDFTFSITDEPLNSVDRIATHNGDVYVANLDRVSRIDLTAAGEADPNANNNLNDVTGPAFESLVGIAFHGSDIYVADSVDGDDVIYRIDSTQSFPATATPLSFSPPIVAIRDIAIDDNALYVLDIDGDGAILKIDLISPSTAVPVYSGGADGPALTEATTIAVRGNEIFVSGLFDSAPEILKITLNGSDPPTATELFDNSLPILTFPYGLVIDNSDNVLYVTDLTTLHGIDLDNPSSGPQEVVSSDLFVAPAGLALLEVTETATTTTVSVVKTVNATSASAGDALLYTITATNTGSSQAKSLEIIDEFPNISVDGQTFVEVFPLDTNIPVLFTSEFHPDGGGSTTTGTCVRVGGTTTKVSCNGYPILEPGDSVVVTLIGIVNGFADDTLVNKVSIEYEGGTNQTTVETILNPSIMFDINKQASTTTVLAGEDSITYTITIFNPDATANDVMITDTLPSGVTIDENTIPSECDVTNNQDGSSILECGPLTISNNDSHEIEYTVQVDSDAINSITNSVSITCPACAPNQIDSTTTTVNRESNLFLEKSANMTQVIAGQDGIQYTISVTNNGPSDAASVVITDTLPSGIIVSSVSGCDDYNIQNNILTCNISSLSSETTSDIIINAVVNSNAIGILENTASVTSDSIDPETADNSDDSDPIEVIRQADVSVIKGAPLQTVAGRIITYNFTVTNFGPSDATDVIVSDEIPDDLVFIPSTQSGSQTDPMCQDQAGTVVCEFGTVVAGQTQIKLIQLQIPLTATGSISNTADITISDEIEELNSDNNSFTVSTEIQPPFCGRAETDFDNIITGTPGNDHIKGTNDDDLIFGLGGNDKIHGKKGNDCIIGGDGDDKIWGGDGDDGIEGNAGNDQIHGQKGNDTLTGGDGNDKVYGGQGNDIIDAGAGDDRVHANQGDDMISGGNGNDWLGAGIGNDNVSGGDGNDKIYGRPGNDIINGDSGDDYIHAGQGNDTVNGGINNDKIFGHEGHDILNGNDNDDYIHGGQGNDNIDGGNGQDKCNGAQGTNTIVNCEIEDKKMKEEHEENDDDEGEPESEDDDNDNHGNNGNNNNNGKGKNK
ncbi:MAG TPA: hypothetical protein VNL34_02835 [Candidatus Nitrosotenuis sp.]|nr:hypothetical protein [Candidatus Nitrosotenuis sp.]